MKALLSPVLSFSLLIPLLSQTSGTAMPAAGAAPQQDRPPTSARAPTTQQPADGGWPRAYTTTSGARLVLYQPQIVSWLDQKRMAMYAAVSYTSADRKTSALGTIRAEANTRVAVPERLVNFSDLEITAVNFPTLVRDQLTAIALEINSAVPSEERVIGLDRVLAAVDKSQIKPRNVEGVKADPPPIFFSDRPAVLVNLDGEPIWSPIKDNALRFAVNTNWELFEFGTPAIYYLRVDHQWMTASNVEGPWTRATTLPESLSRLPNDDNWKDVRAALAAGQSATSTPTPTVFVSKVPAELIELNGAAKYAPIAGTQLQWVSNTDSDVFRVGATGAVYFLVSGRWFTAPGFHGPWAFATPSLPGDFTRIPLEHPRSRVLASVPGTTRALEAVLLAQVPQTARVSRTETTAPDVMYQGDPQFEAISQTTIARAVNTDKDILQVGDLYYMCFDGVWFVGRSATGPWTVADAIPSQVYEIPISSPAYAVTAVTVDQSDDDAVVFSAAAAYTGMMVAWGTAMWGTGYYYPPYFWGGGLYPVYYPRYPSYGYGARYNPWGGAYSRGGAVYGPYGGAGYAARYNPRTGTYARGAAAWGPGGARGAAQAWNPRTGTYAQTRQGANIYGSWGGTAVQRGNQWASTARVTNRATGATTRVSQGSGGGGVVSRNGVVNQGAVGRTAGGDVYAGRDGNVYRKEGGSWQQYNNGNWNSVDRSNTTRDQLNRDYGARTDGAQRTRDLGRVNSGAGGSFNGGSSYRPSGGFGGGGFRGGGGRGGGRR